MNFCQYSCVLCHRPLAIAGQGLCSSCQKQIAAFPYCGRCGAMLQRDQMGCGNCLNAAPKWDHMVITARYLPPLSHLIHQFKFRNGFWLDRTLARLLFLSIRQARRTHCLPLPDLILPVPLHHFRQWSRGYNQSALLAKHLSAWLQIPYATDLLWRHRHTPTQRGLTSQERRHNLKNAFQLAAEKERFANLSIALVDDVITTGATLNEIAKLLRQAGVRQIQVWGLARA